MGRMWSAYLEFDSALRAFKLRAGDTAYSRALVEAGRELRRFAAKAALADQSTQTDAKENLQAVLQAALNAGLNWQDLVEVVNKTHERIPSSGRNGNG